VDVEPVKQQLQEGRIDVVTFTSSSTVRNFVELLGGAESARHLVAQAVIACIGPITARTAEEYGLAVTIMPAENTVPALAEAIAKHYSEGVSVGMSAPR
jgi:uroporphyrinogen III methyltransferase/synthase